MHEHVYVLLYISCEGQCYIYMNLISDVGGDWGEVIEIIVTLITICTCGNELRAHGWR